MKLTKHESELLERFIAYRSIWYVPDSALKWKKKELFNSLEDKGLITAIDINLNGIKANSVRYELTHQIHQP
jgi:hypothetical protein